MKRLYLIGIVLTVLLALNVNALTPPTGGITYYNFSSTTDLWGSNDATNNGATSVLDYPTYNISGDSSPNSFSFDGNDGITGGNDTSLNIQNDGEFAVYGRFKTNGIGFSTTYSYLIGKYTTLGSDYGWLVGFTDRGSTGNFKLEFYNRDNTGSDDAIYTTASVDDDNWHSFIVYQNGTGASNMFIEIDGVVQSVTVHSNDNVLFHDNEGELKIGYREGNLAYYNGEADEIKLFSEIPNKQERLNLHNYGNVNGDIPPLTVNDSSESTAVVKQVGSVAFVNPTTIVSSSFNVSINNTPMYGGYSFNVQSNNNNIMSCDLEIDGISQATVTRSNINGVKGSVFIQTPILYLDNSTSHTQELICARNSGLGLTTITEAVGIGHFLVDEDNIILEHNETNFTKTITSGNLFSLIDTFNITTSNKSSDDQYNNIVLEGALTYTNNNIIDEELATYMTINGNNCSTNNRDVRTGNTGSLTTDCILENATNSTTYTINIYGNGTNAEYIGNIVAKNLFISDEEIAGGTGILKGYTFTGNTDTKIFNLTGGNLNHALANVFQKVGYSIETDLDTEVNLWVKVIDGDTFTTKNFTREYEAGKIGFLTGHDILENVPQDPNYQIELWANCGTVGATCNITGGSSLGYITDVTTTIINSFNIYAHNNYTGESIQNFTVTNGAIYNTTNGVVEYVTTDSAVNLTISSNNFYDFNQEINTNESFNASMIKYTEFSNKDFFDNSNFFNEFYIDYNGNTYYTNNNLLYIPTDGIKNSTVYGTEFTNKSLIIPINQTYSTELLNNNILYTFYAYAKSIPVQGFIKDSITNIEQFGENISINGYQLFYDYIKNKNITFTIDPVLDYYVDGTDTININSSYYDYNLSVDQYRLFLTFTQSVNGTYITINNSQYYQTNFTNSELEKDMLEFDLGIINIGFGKNNTEYTNNQQQKYEFVNDYLTNFYDNIYIMENPDEDIYVETFLVNSPITNVYVNLYQYTPNGTAMLVSKRLSDSEGKTNFRVEQDQQYYITYFKEGYSIVKTADFIPQDTSYTDNTQPLILRLNKDFTTYNFGRLIFRGEQYPVFYNKSINFNNTVYSSVTETLYYSVNGGSVVRIPISLETNNYGLYEYNFNIVPTTTWGNTVIVELYDGDLNKLNTWTYTYHEGREMLDIPTDIKENKTFLILIFIALIIISGISGYAFNNEDLPVNVFMIGLIVLTFVNYQMFGIGGAMALIYFLMQQYKKVVSNE